MSLTLQQLRILHAIVVAGSISQATRSTGLSQPTLSQHLAKFEEDLGTPLIIRGRSTTIGLTAAGDFWFRIAADVLGELDSALQQHRVMFDDRNLALRFGTTPSLRGRFIEVAARTALEIGQIARFDFVWGATSADLVEMISTRQLNCGVVSAASIEGMRSSLHVEPLWRDRIVWTVPASVPDDEIDAVLAGAVPRSVGEALTRYVRVHSLVTWSKWSDDWFRYRLPLATPYFGCVTHQVAVEIVASGLATSHVPMSLLQNLPESVLSRIKAFDIQEYSREVVLVMPRHLLSLGPFKTFCDRICAYARSAYGDGAATEQVDARPLPGRAPSREAAGALTP